MRLFRIPALLLLAVCCNSCVLPIPHQRLHEYGVEGRVVDRKTGHPVRDAKISSPGLPAGGLSAENGNFTLKPVRGWHGAYLFGPISYSIFPTFDMVAPRQFILIESPGYVREKVTVTAGHSSRRSYLEAGDISLEPGPMTK